MIVILCTVRCSFSLVLDAAFDGFANFPDSHSGSHSAGSGRAFRQCGSFHVHSSVTYDRRCNHKKGTLAFPLVFDDSFCAALT